MEPALKQRLIGAAVLVAIAVIFLPMLIKGPAPDSGVSDISLDLPSTPKQGFETRELPLVTPPARNGASVTAPGAGPSGEGALPTVDTRAARDPGNPASGMTPAAVAAGNYAVSFGSYASQSDAQKVVDALHAADFPAFHESVKSGDRTLHRVRIGPFQTSAEAETARIDSARVRKDVGAKVVVLDADRAGSATASASSATTPEKPAQTVAANPEPKPEPPKPKPAEPAKPEPAKPVAASPAPAPAKPEPAAETSKPAPAAAGVGFVVQLGAFGNPAEATALRDRARSQGLSAFVEQVRTADGTLNRVQVGPVADRAAADQLKAQAAAKLGISGFVRAHP
ncbi:SPOR domain-containing protein [Novilysobacter antarcticus]|uniref:SPOR domain-containing protein n=1 Tax=Novilysobacter antarcticus TaxID=2862543 RepID=UPI001C9A13F8|nr:SPOR domain-containing protein [Lysobacter antarcticus]